MCAAGSSLPMLPATATGCVSGRAESVREEGATHLRRRGRTRRRGRGLRAGLPCCLGVCVRGEVAGGVVAKTRVEAAELVARVARVRVHNTTSTAPKSQAAGATSRQSAARDDATSRRQQQDRATNNRRPGLFGLTARSPDKQDAINRVFPGPARRRDRASPFHGARLLWAPSLA
jgi:hypothetical protein